MAHVAIRFGLVVPCQEEPGFPAEVGGSHEVAPAAPWEEARATLAAMASALGWPVGEGDHAWAFRPAAPGEWVPAFWLQEP